MKRERIHFPVGYRLVLAILGLLFIWTCGGTVFAEGEGTEDPEPKSQSVIRHEPQVYVIDYTKESSERIYNEATGQVYVDWMYFPILFPGDKVKVIPDMPDKNKAVSGTANGIVGLVFKDPYEATDRYPIHLTKVVELGNSSKPDQHDNKIIQEFVVEGDGPVVLGSNGGGGYTTEQVELDDLSHTKVTLGYHINHITFRYFKPYLSLDYTYLDQNDNPIDPSKVVTYTENADPDAIWAVDAIHNRDADAEKVTYTISRPYIEGYQLASDCDIYVNSYGYNTPLIDVFDGKDKTEITPRWSYGRDTNGDCSLYVKSDGEWASAVFCFWEAPTVTLDACGGTIDGFATRIYESVDEYDIRKREEAGGLKPVWAGHVFEGWYLDAEYTQKVDSVYDVLDSMPMSEMLEERVAHLYAKWHTLELVKEEAATTKQAGRKAYYKCTDKDCNCIFDAKTLEPITDPASLTIPILPSGWITDTKTGTKKYVDRETGKAYTGFHDIANAKGVKETYYFNAKGILQTGSPSLVKIGKNTYYISKAGVIQKGKKTVNKKICYFDPKTGAMKLKAFVTINKEKYYFGADGVMVTGWKKIGSYKYYFTATGKMVTGWKKIGSSKYYFTATGKMVTGWKTINKKKYYFKISGAMAKSEYWDGYFVNANGVRTNKAKCTWKKTAKGKRFGNKTWYAKSTTLTINGKKYKFNKNGFVK